MLLLPERVGVFPRLIWVANSTFEGTFYLSQASKVVDIPYREEKKAFFCGIFPHFLNSPPISMWGRAALLLTFTRPSKRSNIFFRVGLIDPQQPESPMRPILCVDALEERHLDPAGWAGLRPEVEQHGMPAQGMQINYTASSTP
jgi:hypothetical protein